MPNPEQALNQCSLSFPARLWYFHEVTALYYYPIEAKDKVLSDHSDLTLKCQATR